MGLYVFRYDSGTLNIRIFRLDIDVAIIIAEDNFINVSVFSFHKIIEIAMRSGCSFIIYQENGYAKDEGFLIDDYTKNIFGRYIISVPCTCQSCIEFIEKSAILRHFLNSSYKFQYRVNLIQSQTLQKTVDDVL